MDSEQLQKKLEKAQRNYQSRHLNNLNNYAVSLEKLYDALAHSAAVAGRSLDVPGDRLLKLEDYPAVNRRINKLVRRLTANISAIATKGVSQEWALANDYADELVKLVCVGRKVSEATKSRWLDRREKALDEFRKRKTNGLDLSERVWQLGEQAKMELELALDCGIRDGVAALKLAPTLKQYLKEPDRLYRRVRDTQDKLHLSRAASQYHPGRGVYRSSFANAKRLVGTETNIAYRTADHERMQRLDFVVGIKIELSNNHTTKGPKGLPIPLTDICDELQGKYPKDFKFTGWHPNCRCHAKSILLTPAELDEMLKAQADGEDIKVDGVNKVNGVPREFTSWLKNNRSRAERSTAVPYFIKDNEKYLPTGYANLYALKTPYATYAEYANAMKVNKKKADFAPEIVKNNKDLDRVLPVMQGQIMNFTEADSGRANPHYSDADAKEMGYLLNCQTCTVAYELRRRGFRVEALPNKGNELYKVWCAKKNFNWQDRFLNPDGSRPIMTRPHQLQDSIKAKTEFIEDGTKDEGRYELYLEWKKRKADEPSAHVMVVERQKGGNLLWLDPQSGKHGSAEVFKNFLKRAKPISLRLLRIDNKMINPKFAERFKRASE